MFLSLYIHYPFCARKCPYCDYNSHVRAAIDAEAWQAAYLKALQATAERLPHKEPLGSIFFGGGTPSLMPAGMVAAILETAEALFGFRADIEITLEANPHGLTLEALRAFKDAGVNRVSLGVQALNNADLQALGRDHTVAEALAAITAAQETFRRWSFDMMFGREGQSPTAWEAELKQALALAPSHLSLYQLTLEPNTQFYTKAQHGRLRLPDSSALADMSDITLSLCAEAGLPRYEISSFAQTGEACRHNLNYWAYGDYIGIGPGAHGRLTLPEGRVATTQTALPEAWLRHIEQGEDGYANWVTLTASDQLEEALILGLRTETGLSLSRFLTITGAPPEAVFGARWTSLIEDGLIARDDNALRATPMGLAYLNTIETRLFV